MYNGGFMKPNNPGTTKRNLIAFTAAALFAGMFTGSSDATAQELFVYKGAKVRFGAFGGLNYNFIGAGYQELRDVPGDNFRVFKLNDGTGLGPYVGLIGEYNSGDILGVQVRLSYDSRSGELFDTTGGQNNRFGANVTYFNVEPGLRINLGNPDLHLALGPSIGFTIDHNYDYDPEDDNVPQVEGRDIDKWNNVAIGVWGGIGYDINLSDASSTSRWYLTPFLEGSWVFDQRKSDIPDLQDNIDDVWSTVTARAGVQIKWGSAEGAPATARTIEVTPETPNMDVSLRAPAGIHERTTVEEYFPLLNYVFFDEGSTELPSEYKQINSAQAAVFHENDLFEDPGPGSDRESTRWQRQMSVYHNGLNIFGDRLRNSTAKVTLIGSAPNQNDGLAQANVVKDYLVSRFGIDANRITTKGATRPQNASGTRSTPQSDLPLIAEENRRVEILTEDNTVLKPVTIRTAQGAPIENDLVLDVRPGVSVTEWKVDVTGSGTTKTYGPFNGLTQRIDAQQILGSSPNGTYTARVTATTSDGSVLVKEVPFNLVRRPGASVNDKRYSILFEYDESKTVQTYDKFLREEVAPKIESGSTVFIYGYTDKVGEADYNSNLSLKRTTDAQKIIADQLGSMGRNVTFYTYGFGEGEYLAPFPNQTPEGRYYNRTVIIEIVPGAQASSK